MSCSRSPEHRSPPRVRGLVAAVALFAGIVAQFGVVTHMGLVRHEVCAEHGDLVEGSATAPSPSSVPHLPSASDHDHCQLAASWGTATPTPMAPVAIDDQAPLLLAALASTTAPPTAARTSLPLLCVAPKTSPPA